MSCPLSCRCVRYAYSRYLLEVGWSEIPPDRLTLAMAGYATEDMLDQRTRIFAECFPCRQGGELVNLCPIVSGRGQWCDCHEYRKHHAQAAARARKQVRFAASPRVEIPGEVRRQVAQRDRYKCVYCGKSVRAVKCHVDHVIPLAKGGTSQPDNLALACVSCNQAKGEDIWQRGCRV